MAGMITNSKLTTRGGNNKSKTIFIRDLPVDGMICFVIASDSNFPCQIAHSCKCHSNWVGLGVCGISISLYISQGVPALQTSLIIKIPAPHEQLTRSTEFGLKVEDLPRSHRYSYPRSNRTMLARPRYGSRRVLQIMDFDCVFGWVVNFYSKIVLNEQRDGEVIKTYNILPAFATGEI